MSEVPYTDENVEICKQNCGVCPTFKANNLGDLSPGVLFCSQGKSPREDIEDNGCNCPTCPIFQEYGLEGGYFCTYGIEGKQT